MEIPYHKVDVEAEPLPFTDSTFDLVLFCEILEHLRLNPLKALQETYRVLKSGGSLLLSTPHITPLMRWRFLWGEDFNDDIIEELGKLDSIGHMGHFRLYSYNEVKKILVHVGFKLIRNNLGGNFKIYDKRFDAMLFRKLMHRQMLTQLYVWAKKP